MNSNELAHFGILGMKWGVRNDRTSSGYSRREVAKDAHKQALAKASYGEGAGIKRRHVKSELERKMKDPEYKKMFDEEFAKVNWSKVNRKAKVNRTGLDTKKQAVSTTKAIATFLTGTGSLAAAYILYTQNKPAVDAFMSQAFNKTRFFVNRSTGRW